MLNPKANLKWINSYELGHLVLSNKRTGQVLRCPLDNEDHAVARLFQWCPRWTKSIRGYYLIANVKTQLGWKIEYIHRLILKIKSSRIKADHINHNTLDNRKCNLRIATHRQNLCNMHKKGATGYPCVRKNTHSSTYYVLVDLNGKRKYLGSFKTIHEAAEHLYLWGQQKLGPDSPYQRPNTPLGNLTPG